MRCMLFVYHDEVAWADLPAEEREATVQKYVAFYQEVEKHGLREANATMKPSATAQTVRTHDGQMQPLDGPYAPETRLQLGGVYILNCRDMDEAVELAKLNPAAQFGAVEIRPVVEN